MANFSTHVTGAAAASGLLSTMFLKAGLVAIPEAFILTFAGTLGGILPDVDLKHSHPSKIIFTALAVLLSLLWVFATNASLSILELWLFGLLLFLIIRYPVWALFHQFTVHRGSLHSVVAALMFGMLSVAFSYRIFGQGASSAWLTGIFVSAGCIFHLVLDELYSVDFIGQRIKRSFGSALKLIDFDRLIASSLIILITIIAWLYAPPGEGLWQKLGTIEHYDRLLSNLVPDALPDYLRKIVDTFNR